MRAIFLAVLLAFGLIAILFVTLPSPAQAESNGLEFPGDENWDKNIGSINITHTVHAVAFDKNYLYVGEGYGSGDKHIRRWDGASWQSIANNVDGAVLELLPTAEGLYAGGYFTRTGSCSSCKRVAIWNGSNWSAVGNGIDGPVTVFALARDSNGKLYAGGDFGVMQLGGATWMSFNGGLPSSNTVFDMVLSGTLYIAGRYYNEEYEDYYPMVKSFNGNTWEDFDASFVPSANLSSIYAIEVTNEETLVIGGDFIEPVQRLSYLEQSNWTSFGNPDDPVLALAADSCGGLYIGGLFRKIDNSPNRFLAYYDGSSWQSLGDTFTINSKKVEVLDFYHGYLAVGGVFTQTLEEQTHRNIALWTGRDCVQVTASGTYTLYNWREPVVIHITEPGTLAEIRVQRFNKDHPAADATLTPNLKNGVYWQIEGLDSQGQPANGFVYTLTLPSIGFTPDDKDKICHYMSSISKWDCAASAFDAEKKTITRSGLTSFSEFTVGDNVGPNVISLRSFHTKPHDSAFSVVIFLMLGIGCLIYLRRGKG
ncbi:MAG: hypothetical protein DDG59_06105 [Anaerolineae bacterium]|nr:MAG: hypothetical protein DDG59_06105 [Anaerolineae bacterium]